MAVDPGRAKCGVAVCGPAGTLAHRIVETAALAQLAVEWVNAFRVELVIVGDQTGSKHVFGLLDNIGVPVRRVIERGSTLAARQRYFQDHPRTGWRRWVPISLQVPPEPYDDYAAVVLAESYLARLAGGPASH